MNKSGVKQKRLLRTGVKAVTPKEPEKPKEKTLQDLTEEVKLMRYNVDSMVNQIAHDFGEYNDNFFVDEFTENIGLSPLKQF